MHPSVRTFAFAFLCFLTGFSTTNIAQGKSKDPIRVGLGEQTRQKVAAHVFARTLKRAGFRYEFVEFGGSQIEMIASGAAHVSPAFFVAKEREALEQAIAGKKIISLGGLRGNGAGEPEMKIIWAGMRQKWPYAERMLKTMIMPPNDIEGLTKTIDAGDMTIDQAVDGWMKDNPGKWKRWLSASTNWMKP